MTRSCSSTIAATCRSLWVSTPPTIRHTPSMTAIPSLQVDRASMASPGPNAWTGQSRDHEGKDLLGSHASARQSLTARRSRAVDRSGERHGWSISVWVRPHRAPRGASLTGWSIAMRAGPPGNWRLSSDCLDGALAALSPGDTLVVWKLDRLGRSLSQLVTLIAELGARRVNFRSLSDPIDT